MTDHLAHVLDYLEVAAFNADRDNDFGHGLFLGRALEYADQSGLDPDLVKEALFNQGLGEYAALIAESKMKVHRG